MVRIVHFAGSNIMHKSHACFYRHLIRYRLGDDNDDDLDHPVIRHITSDLLHSMPSKNKVQTNGEDLLSELNLTEVMQYLP